MRSFPRSVVALIVPLLIAAVSSAASAEVLSTAFTYQGEINQSGSPLNGVADFEFSLYDAVSGGTQVGTTLAISGVTVNDGIFATLLDFGVDVFNGEARYLEIAVRSPAGIGAYSTLSPRVTLTPTPYALQTRGIFVDSNENVRIGSPTPPLSAPNQPLAAAPPAEKLKIWAHNPGDVALDAEATAVSGASDGVHGKSASSEGRGVVGEATAASGETRGVVGKSHSSNGEGVRGEGKTGVHGASAAPGGRGIMGEAEADSSSVGVHGKSNAGQGVRGEGKTGIHGSSSSPGGKGIMGEAGADGNSIGVHGKSNAGEGVRGEGKTGIHGSSAEPGGKGIMGEVTAGNGTAIFGMAADSTGTNIGIHGKTNSTSGFAGYFEGRAYVSERLGVGTTTPTALIDADGVNDTGVRGSTGADDGFGVIGRSFSGDPASAGVLAQGGTTEFGTGAAALNLQNGALVVSGQYRPAGRLEFDAQDQTWNPINSCNPSNGTVHTHTIGYQAELDLSNDLIQGDSIVLLTVERMADAPGVPLVSWSVQVNTTSTGTITMLVSTMGTSTAVSCQPPDGFFAVNYLIINPSNP